ncbi:hypothetical protein FRB98_002307 [Tulasnella sp. 332]|nr:hypothetical protein FRB98_002307 [Tulasnella sp. 332]
MDDVHRALKIPEVLRSVFLYADKPTLARAGRICHFLSPAALDFLWEKVDTIAALIGLLHPLVLLDENAIEVTSTGIASISTLVAFANSLVKTAQFMRADHIGSP